MHPLTKTFFYLLIGFLLAASQANAQDSPTSAIEESSLGGTNNVHRHGDLFFAGQFSQDDVAIINEAKIVRIVSLSLANEIDWDEEAAIKKAGIEFIRLPYKAPETLPDEVFDRPVICSKTNRNGRYSIANRPIELQEFGFRIAFLTKALAWIRHSRKLWKSGLSNPS